MTVRELVKALGVTTTAVRLQVDRLVGDGILAVDKRGGRRGRPSDVFRLTERGQSLISHQYDGLIDDILTELAKRDGKKKVSDLLGSVAVRIADRYAERVNGAATTQEKFERLADVLREQDIHAEVSFDGGRVVLRQCGCPYYKLARSNHSICGVHIGMLRRLSGLPVKRVRCIARGDTQCEFRIETNGHAGRQSL
jgi:predicted ArsR family transcriptional regulator